MRARISVPRSAGACSNLTSPFTCTSEFGSEFQAMDSFSRSLVISAYHRMRRPIGPMAVHCDRPRFRIVITILNRGRSQWTAIGPMGRRIRWYAEITSDRENESIAWNSLPNSDVQVNGEVRFEQAPADRGTLIRARIDYSPSLGTSSALAKFLNKGVNFLMRQDLRRLEAIMEAGEIPTIEGQSHGPRDVVTGAMRVADPTRPVRRGSDLREVFAMRRSVA